MSSLLQKQQPNKKGTKRREGFLMKYVTVFGWQTRWITLYDYRIMIKMRDYLNKIGTFELNRHCIAADSNEREFCFYVRDTQTNRTISLAASDASSKEAWMDAIQGVLAFLRKEHLATKSITGVSPSVVREGKNTIIATHVQPAAVAVAEISEGAAKYQARSMIYIKVIRAANLRLADTEQAASGKETKSIEVYTKVTLGNSSAKTITRREKDSVVEWGMVFTYAWDMHQRFGTIEVFEASVGGDILLGTAVIPVLNCYDEENHDISLPLCKTSKGQRLKCGGFVEVQLSCSGCPDKQQLLWRFLKEVQKLPEMHTSLIPREMLYVQDSLSPKEEQRLDDTVVATPTADTFDNNDKEDDNLDPYTGIPKEYYTRHRSSLHEYQKSGVLDDVREIMKRERNLQGNDDSTNSGPNTAPTPAKKAMANALDLSITPVSMAGTNVGYSRQHTPHSPIGAGTTPGGDVFGDGESNFIDVSSQSHIRVLGAEDEGHEDNDLDATGADNSIAITEPDTDIMDTPVVDRTRDSSQPTPLEREEASKQIGGIIGDDDDEESLFNSNGFPFLFPGSEEEIVEDFCMRCDFESLQENDELTVRGVLILTSFRLIFISIARIFSEDEFVWQEFKEYDLTTFIPISNIVKIERSTIAANLPDGTQAMREILKIKTTECRTLQFSFIDVDVSYDQLQNTAMNLIKRGCSYTHFDTNRLERERKSTPQNQFDACITELGKIFHDFFSIGTFLIDGCDSSEGSAFTRIYHRVSIRTINRLPEREYYIHAHQKILAMVRSTAAIVPQNMTNQLWNMTDEERFELLKSTELETEQMLSKARKHDEKADSDQNPIDIMREEGSLANFGKRLLASSLETRVALRSLLSTGWSAYNAMDEFVRMGVPNRNWRMTNVNIHYELCSTYPQILAVPAKIDDEILKDAATFRSMRRIPTLVWRSKLNGATICRCSQPLVGIRGHANEGDEALINQIHQSSDLDEGSGGTTTTGKVSLKTPKALEKEAAALGVTPPPVPSRDHKTPVPPQSVRRSTKMARHRPYIIIDCRPQLNARANQANGKGFEQEHRYENISVQWMDIDNIHVVRQSLASLEEQCQKRSGWLAGLSSSGWLKHIRRILVAAVKIAHCVATEEISVMVHCSDGWDRTPQLTSLGMLMLDPYYRTIKGFIVLIEKEWVSFGHKFQDRTGWSAEGHNDERERSPVFIQWLDCVHQCLSQRPNDFEFNEDLLLFIAKHVYSGWFGNFLFNCEKDSIKYRNKMSIISIWTCVLGNIDKYKNAGYKVNPGLSIPVPTKPRIELWKAYFCPWMDQLWRASFINDATANGLLFASPNFLSKGEMHLNGGILGIGGNGFDDNDAKLLDTTVVNRPWISDQLVHQCTRCRQTFNMFVRKHHCRCCGNIFCDPCSCESRIVAALSSWQSQRVCIDCAEKLDTVEMDKQKDTPKPMTANVNEGEQHRADSDDWGMDVNSLRKGQETGYIGLGVDTEHTEVASL